MQAQPSSLSFPPLFQVLVPQQHLYRHLLLIVAGSLFVAVMAQIAIPLPFTPVPITGQTLGVLLVGSTLGWRLGFLALLTYLVEGACGLPFFSAGGSGLERIWGPTGGYLLSFPLTAALIGYLVERFGSDRNFLKMVGSMALCSLVTFTLGATWLGVWLAGLGKFAGVWDVLGKGVFPFIPGDIVKMSIASSLLPITWRWVNRPTPQTTPQDPED
ncbi:MAG: biotin transporter BioY [Cyanobacteriota bacterium]|nr:biotin transporter BioY [Cyanobacteriota bacterium]